MLERAADVERLKKSIRIARDILARRPLEGFVGAALPPLAESQSDRDLEDFIRANAITFRHPLGTCRMGVRPEDGAVVDSELRVFGLDALRVVDAA